MKRSTVLSLPLNKASLDKLVCTCVGDERKKGFTPLTPSPHEAHGPVLLLVLEVVLVVLDLLVDVVKRALAQSFGHLQHGMMI
jgi:hypothetical protein